MAPLYIGNMFHKFRDKKTHSMVTRNDLHNLYSEAKDSFV